MNCDYSTECTSSSPCGFWVRCSPRGARRPPDCPKTSEADQRDGLRTTTVGFQDLSLTYQSLVRLTGTIPRLRSRPGELLHYHSRPLSCSRATAISDVPLVVEVKYVKVTLNDIRSTIESSVKQNFHNQRETARRHTVSAVSIILLVHSTPTYLGLPRKRK